MIQNTQENKARFYALHWGQYVIVDPKNTYIRISSGVFEVERIFRVGADYNYIYPHIKDGYLELTPLSQISDEDAIICAKLIYKYDDTPSGKIASERSHTAENGKDYVIESIQDSDGVFHSVVSFEVVDFLRSRGYALPWMGTSVETFIEWGWVKLKGGENG